ncbi:MAG: hypothetical protein V3T83_21980 [Acidobacteriota bacterium]
MKRFQPRAAEVQIVLTPWRLSQYRKIAKELGLLSVGDAVIIGQMHFVDCWLHQDSRDFRESAERLKDRLAQNRRRKAKARLAIARGGHS